MSLKTTGPFEKKTEQTTLMIDDLNTNFHAGWTFEREREEREREKKKGLIF